MLGATLLVARYAPLSCGGVRPLCQPACFVVLTLGERLVYPLSMALVTRLAPPHATATAMSL